MLSLDLHTGSKFTQSIEVIVIDSQDALAKNIDCHALMVLPAS